MLFWTIWCLLFWYRTKIEWLTQFSKKKSQMVETGIYLKIRGGRKFFWKLRQSLNFSSISKKKSSNCSEEQSPYRKNNKKYIYIYIRGGGSPWTFCLPLKNCSYENWRAPPPLIWGRGGFKNIFLLRGSLSRTIYCNPFWNRRKIDKVVFFLKKYVKIMKFIGMTWVAK